MLLKANTGFHYQQFRITWLYGDTIAMPLFCFQGVVLKVTIDHVVWLQAKLQEKHNKINTVPHAY